LRILPLEWIPRRLGFTSSSLSFLLLASGSPLRVVVRDRLYFVGGGSSVVVVVVVHISGDFAAAAAVEEEASPRG
jgi:hypothetical protein